MNEEADAPIIETEKKSVPDENLKEVVAEGSDEIVITSEEKASILGELLPGGKYEEIFRKAVRICRSKGFSNEEAEDIAQEAVCVLDKKPPPEAGLVKWVNAILRNKMRRAFERRAKFTAIDDLPEGELISQTPKPIEWDERKLLVILEQCFGRCLDKLSEEANELFIEYKGIEGKQDSAVREHLAEKLGIKYGTLRTKISRTMDNLSECMKRCCQNDEFACRWKNYVTKDNLKAYINQKFENE